jgi:glycosyltransferase involved in cell wall biosynthesis
VLDPSPEGQVEVSIVIPSKITDEPTQECINSLLNQNFQRKYEILNVIGGNIPQAKNHA